MKTINFLKPSSLVIAGGMLFGLAACGSSNGSGASSDVAPEPSNAATAAVTASPSYIQTTMTTAASPGSVFQSAVSETYDGLASSTSKLGSTDSPDVSAAVDEDLAKASKTCIAMTSNPSPLEPNNLPTQYMITWTYTNCERRFGQSTLSGTREISVTNDANDLTRTVDGSLALTRRYPDGSLLTEDNNSQIVDQGARNDANNTITRTASLDGNAVFQSANGNDRYNHSFSHQLTLVDTFDPNSLRLTERVVNGTGNMHHNLIDADSTVTYTNVTYEIQTCGWPVSGTVATATTLKNGTVNSEKITFSLPCGTATDPNGTKINLSNF